ncbi:hypothetical protein [Pseudoalteromonas rubra]|uniref:hypothetical protein n=1 Tax=Pseudoalteromonas rubra TaxID=43658 RepID=UPI000A9292CE|nr:hypothetical protein [Pseudoalteromonas rubra]
MKLTVKAKKLKSLSSKEALQSKLTPLVQGGLLATPQNGDKPFDTQSDLGTCSPDYY